jgi:hypothetical protein
MICNKLSQAFNSLVEASIGEQDFAASEPCPGQFPLCKNVIEGFERVRQVPELEIQVEPPRVSRRLVGLSHAAIAA